MTDSFVTQCPHCQTSFRVSHTQLSVARGVVRCGSCLQVFNAARQLLEQRMGEEAQALTPPPAVIPQPEQRAISQKQWTAAELDLDHLDLDQELARLEQREIQPTQAFGQPRKPREESLSASRDSGWASHSRRPPAMASSTSGPNVVRMWVSTSAPPLNHRSPRWGWGQSVRGSSPSQKCRTWAAAGGKVVMAACSTKGNTAF